MAEQVPSTELERMNVTMTMERIRASIHAAIPEFGTGAVMADMREKLKKLTADFLDEIRSHAAIKDYRIGDMRRQLFKDVYRLAQDRATALKVFWRRRKTKEPLYWTEGEEVPEKRFEEFGHLLELQLWGMNDDLTGCVLLRKPSGHIMDLFITPVKTVPIISIDMEIKDGQVQFT